MRRTNVQDVLTRLRFRVEWSRDFSIWEGTIEQWLEARSSHPEPSGALAEVVELARAAIEDGISPGAVLRHRSPEVTELARQYGFGDISVFGACARGEDNLASRVELTAEPFRSGVHADARELEFELARLLGFRVQLNNRRPGQPSIALNVFAGRRP